MEVSYKKENYLLGKRERKLESEAPAVRVKMLIDETKVIGMMAPKIQIMISFPSINSYNNGLHNILEEYKTKIVVYTITNSNIASIKKVKNAYSIDEGFISNDFKNFSLKFGVNINDELMAKSIFVIDKEGVIKYIEIPSDIESSFDLKTFKEKLEETVNFKQKGHSHENWMGV